VQRETVHPAEGGGGAGVGSEPLRYIAGDAASECLRWAPTGGDFEAQLHTVDGEDAQAMLRRLGAAGGSWCCRLRWAGVTILGSSHRCTVLSRRRTGDPRPWLVVLALTLRWPRQLVCIARTPAQTWT
jgi:hypothetical protein